MSADVEVIADKAAKEAHQEAALLVLQRTWDRVEFCVTMSKETETPLINMSENDLEVTRVGLTLSFVELEALRGTANRLDKAKLTEHRLWPIYGPICSVLTVLDVRLLSWVLSRHPFVQWRYWSLTC